MMSSKFDSFDIHCPNQNSQADVVQTESLVQMIAYGVQVKEKL